MNTDLQIRRPITAQGAVWCLHCERAYEDGDFRLWKDPNGYEWTKPLRLCPYEGCNGGVFIDGWDWDTVRGYNGGYPEVPERDLVYPLYGGGPVSADVYYKRTEPKYVTLRERFVPAKESKPKTLDIFGNQE